MGVARRSAEDAPRAWQRMLSGRRLDLLDPSPLDIEISDIAHGLARVARWNGQTTGDHAFSVAQHCLLVEEIARLITPSLTTDDCLAALLHDAPEYVIGDMISPFKAVIGTNYKQVETRLATAVRRRFGLPAAMPQTLGRKIKEADRISAFCEATRLAGFTHDEARAFFGKPHPKVALAGLDRLLTPWPTRVAEQGFLDRFADLFEG